MKRLMGLCGWVVLLLLAGIGIVTVFTHRSPPEHAPVVREADCNLPCWQGISPGHTLSNVAHRILISQGYTTQNIPSDDVRTYFSPSSATLDCDVRVQHWGGLVFEIRFINCIHLRLGDVINALGSPDSVAAGGTHVNFDQGRVRATLIPPDCDDAISPYMRVNAISLISEMDTEVTDVPWRGFQSPYRYTQHVASGIVIFNC